jgi:hypothetical protein
MADTDPRRTVHLRIVADLEAPDGRPGDVIPFRASTSPDAMPWALGILCPGCGSASLLPLTRPESAPTTHPVWTVTGGDPRTSIVSLAPSIHHTKALGGCGWHGYLTRGVFSPC